MGGLVLVAPEARLWSADGFTATVLGAGLIGMIVLIDGEREPVPTGFRGWAMALSCEYCDRPAEVQLRDGQPGDVLCKECARDQFQQVAAWVRPIPRAVVRELFGQCKRLG